MIDENSWIKDVELSQLGEIFLNPEIGDIIKYAHEKNVTLEADNGVNLNSMDDELCEAMVRYRFRSMTCSIDGADNETYQLYRRQGDFNRVISNIRKINEFKEKYSSEYPHMRWQFVAFGHNEHAIQKAREMAKVLNMEFYVKLSWGNMYTDAAFSPVNNKDFIRKETGLGAADREEYYRKYGVTFVRGTCFHMWKEPQLNFDGRVLGCCTNLYGDYGNAFNEGLLNCLNNEKMNYARSMLLGKKTERKDIPCIKCESYRTMKKDKKWLSTEEIGI